MMLTVKSNQYALAFALPKLGNSGDPRGANERTTPGRGSSSSAASSFSS